MLRTSSVSCCHTTADGTPLARSTTHALWRALASGRSSEPERTLASDTAAHRSSTPVPSGDGLTHRVKGPQVSRLTRVSRVGQATRRALRTHRTYRTCQSMAPVPVPVWGRPDDGGDPPTWRLGAQRCHARTRV